MPVAETADVAVVGSCNYDQIVYVNDFPAAGATIYGSAYATGFGGKGANQCVMAAKLGAKTAMIGALGSDQIAAITRENFSSVGVDTRHLCTKDGASGVAQICVSAKDGNNNIVIVPGANLLFSEADVLGAKDVICNAKVVLLQNEVPAATTLAAMGVARSSSSGPVVILNAAPAPTLGENWQEGQWQKDKVAAMLSSCHILCVNEVPDPIARIIFSIILTRALDEALFSQSFTRAHTHKLAHAHISTYQSEAEVLSGVSVGGETEEQLLQSILVAGAKL